MPSLPSYLPVILLTLAMIIGVPVAYRAWREAHEEDEPVTDEDVLSGIEEAYYAGEIAEAEFRRVRELLGKGSAKGAKAGISRRASERVVPVPPPEDDAPPGPTPPPRPPNDPP